MKCWYVVQVYAGFEKVVQGEILKIIQEQQAQDLFGDILVPSAKTIINV